MRVLYFTVVPLVDESDGGRIHCRTLVRRLTQDRDIELFAISAGKAEWKAGTEAFFKSLSIPHEFMEFREGVFRPREDSLASLLRFLVTALFNIPWELQALNQEHIQAAIEWGIRTWKPDTLLLDYYASALFVPLPRGDVRTAIVKLNREADFYADQIKHGQTIHGSWTRGISLWRAKRFEQRVDAAVDKVITIGRPDLPRHKVRSQPVCITPYLDGKTERWRFSDSNSVFFVGHIRHYPNRLAIEWLATSLAPLLETQRKDIKIVIVGASSEQVPQHWRRQNIDYRGVANAAAVHELFCSADLLVCPIENDFGVKFKVAEALAYGTPVAMSAQTALGFPYLNAAKAFSLDQPEQAAKLIAGLVGDRNVLQTISRAQTDEQEAFIDSQQDIWSKTLGGGAAAGQDIPEQKNDLVAAPSPMQEVAAKTVDVHTSYSPRHFSVTGSAIDQSVVGAIEKAGGSWEPQIMTLMARNIRASDVCLDIGANIGVHALVMADLTTKGQVRAIEPSSVNFNFLRRNIAANHFTNVIPHRVGMGERTEEKDFYYLSDFAGCSFAEDKARSETPEAIIQSAWNAPFHYVKERVPFVTLDEWALRTGLTRLDFIKLDAEGSELAVLRGGDRTLSRFKPSLVTEFNVNALRHYFQADPQSYFDLLAGKFEKISVIKEDGEQIRVTSFAELSAHLTSSRWWVDLFCSNR